ncbi:MAG: hypothetical protein OEM76_12365, partial [Gammaproteobacteria bacterium]|nr:hypothetical protein [Gammaproteobacteria bacterium]
IWLRHNTPLLRLRQFVHGTLATEGGEIEIRWRRPDGQDMPDQDWEQTRSFAVAVKEGKCDGETAAVTLLFNGSHTATDFELPVQHDWQLAFASDADACLQGRVAELPQQTIAILLAQSIYRPPNKE